MYHIKRDGGWLCKPSMSATKMRKLRGFCRAGEIDYNHALKLLSLKNCCPDCKEKLEERIQNSKELIVVPYVAPKKERVNKPLKTILITEGVIRFNDNV